MIFATLIAARLVAASIAIICAARLLASEAQGWWAFLIVAVLLGCVSYEQRRQ